MARLATALGTDPMALTATALLEGQSAAATDAGLAELDRIQDCAGRFPGWAALLAETHRRAEGLFFHAGKVLNDRLGHDPQLSASLREMLTAGAPARSTAGVLAESDDIAPEWRAKFHANLQEDSERLVAGAEALVAFLDGAAMGLGRSLTVVPPRRKWNRRLAGLGAGGAGLCRTAFSARFWRPGADPRRDADFCR